jgi:hypothetical protein
MDLQEEHQARKQTIVSAILFGVVAGLTGIFILLPQPEYAHNLLKLFCPVTFAAVGMFIIVWIGMWFLIILTRELIRYL